MMRSWTGILLIGIGIADSAIAGGHADLFTSAYRIVDIHSHGSLPTERALQAHFEVMDAVGVDAIALLLVDCAGWDYAGGWSEHNLRAWLALQREHPDRVAVFTTVDFGRVAHEPQFFEAIVDELQTAAEMGAAGVKIWKNLGMHHRDASGALLKIDDSRLDPFWERCGELGLPVVIHSADPKEYWYPNTYNTFQYKIGDTAKYHNHAYVPRWEDLIEQRNNVLERHPQTTFIGAHFGSMTTDLDGLAQLLDACPNFHVECGARLRFFYRYHPQAIRDFFIKYQDRILFGTDVFLPESDTELDDAASLQAWQEHPKRMYSDYLEYFETDHFVQVPGGFESDWLRLKGISLPAAVLEKFYHSNAEGLLPRLRENPSGAQRP